MATGSIQITSEALERFNQSIRTTLDSKQITNTGRARDSIRIVVNQNSVASVGVDYLEILNKGRGSGKFPPPDSLRNWVRSKLSVPDDNVNQVAYLIGRKIALEGTRIFKNNSLGIELEDKIKLLNAELKRLLPEAFKYEIQVKLNKFANERLKKS